MKSSGAGRFLIFLPVLLLALSADCLAQRYEPLELARKLFGKERFANSADYASGEYDGHPNGQDLPEGATTSFRLLTQSERAAVVAVTVTDSSGKGMDGYLHFVNDSGWKVGAFRTLSLTGPLQQQLSEMEGMTPAQVDRMIAETGGREGGIRSRKDFDFVVENIRLTLALDDTIVRHFLLNKAAFEQLRDAAYRELDTLRPHLEEIISLATRLRPVYRRLLISAVESDNYLVGGGGLTFVIGGMVDNEVGYLYVKDKKDLPELDPDRLIMLREIGGGWYLYKTT